MFRLPSKQFPCPKLAKFPPKRFRRSKREFGCAPLHNLFEEMGEPSAEHGLFQSEICPQRELSSPEFLLLLKRPDCAVSEPQCRHVGKRTSEEFLVKCVGISPEGISAIEQPRNIILSRSSASRPNSGPAVKIEGDYK